MAVLIYDKRGLGESSGSYAQSTTWTVEGIANCADTFNLLGADALAGIEALRTRSDIDPRRVGFAGISQAGWIMPLAASRSAHVAFIVNVSGPAVTCGLEDWYSQLTGEYRAYPEFHAPAPYSEGELSDEEIERQLDQYEGPEGYDPVPILKSLRVPSLWVLGGQDRSVPTSRSVANLKRLIASGAPIDLLLYPEGDHLLRIKGSNFRRIDFWSDVWAWFLAQGVLPAPKLDVLVKQPAPA